MKIKNNLILSIIIPTILLVSGCSGSDSTENVIPEKEVMEPEGKIIEIPVSEISSQAKFYMLDSDGVEINYFAVKGSDGKIRTAFDACDICGGYKGYRQSGNDMVCNNCGLHFNIDDLGTKNKGGGCWPSYLGHEIRDTTVIIQKEELVKGRGFFK